MRDGHFRKTAHEQQRDERPDGVAQQHRRAGQPDREPAAEKQPRTDGAADGDHREARSTQTTLQTSLAFDDFQETLFAAIHLLLSGRRVPIGHAGKQVYTGARVGYPAKTKRLARQLPLRLRALRWRVRRLHSRL